ncbi:DUF1127 domain-containing protein [Salinarimonas soli]|uniref:DUF1127 domain-containing protein n=1 Tax=Salinarimonas soli TaxID=1638099 RepID=A0A5B2VAQ4_9HYPH|nr:DUF1127 domain-containing protein [Salinarimonas soli]
MTLIPGLTGVIRTLRNRRAVQSTVDLDDRILTDIGLRSEDLTPAPLAPEGGFRVSGCMTLALRSGLACSSSHARQG